VKRGPIDASATYFWSSSDKGQLLVSRTATSSSSAGAWRFRRLRSTCAWPRRSRASRPAFGYATLNGRFDSNGDDRIDSDLDGTNISPDGLNLSLAYDRGPLSALLQHQVYFSRRFDGIARAADDANPRHPARLANNDFGGYALTDASIRYQTGIGGLSASVQNLFDKFYIDYSSDTRLPTDPLAVFSVRRRTFTLTWTIGSRQRTSTRHRLCKGSRALNTLDLLHRWTGGLIGLVLALLGLTGALLVHKDAWVMLPHARDAQVTDANAVAATVEGIMADPATRPESIIFASENFGLHRLSYKGGAGAYVDQAGHVVTRWHSQWQRPELWLFDFHHHLLSGDNGEIVVGIAGVCGLFFVASVAVLWWRTRKTLEFRLWPKRMSRPAIVRHHRDLGIVVAPLPALHSTLALRWCSGRPLRWSSDSRRQPRSTKRLSHRGRPGHTSPTGSTGRG
jgi:hypothetical protein